MMKKFASVRIGALIVVGLDDPTTTAAQDATSQPINERHHHSVDDASRVPEPSNVPLTRSARCKTTPDSKTLSGIRFGGVLHSYLCVRHFAEVHT